MEILVVYSSLEQSYIHEQRFDGADEILDARDFAVRMNGLLLIKVSGESLRVEDFTQPYLTAVSAAGKVRKTRRRRQS